MKLNILLNYQDVFLKKLANKPADKVEGLYFISLDRRIWKENLLPDSSK
jgi:hypothetical protein